MTTEARLLVSDQGSFSVSGSCVNHCTTEPLINSQLITCSDASVLPKKMQTLFYYLYTNMSIPITSVNCLKGKKCNRCHPLVLNSTSFMYPFEIIFLSQKCQIVS